MTTRREQLQGTRKLFRLRRIKEILFAVLVILAIALSAYATVFAGASVKPLYIPISSFVSIVLALLIIACVANFVFRTLEIRYSKRDSQRFFVAKNSIRQSYYAFAIAAILGGILILPFTSQAVNDHLTQRRDGTVPGLVTSPPFRIESRDALAMTQITRIRIAGSQPLRVSFEGFNPNASCPPECTFSPSASGLVTYQITITNPNRTVVEYQMVIESVLLPEYTSVIPGLLWAFAAANAVWIVYATPIRRKHEAASIYSVRYQPEVKPGERIFVEHSRARRARAKPVPSGPPSAPPRVRLFTAPAVPDSPVAEPTVPEAEPIVPETEAPVPTPSPPAPRRPPPLFPPPPQASPVQPVPPAPTASSLPEKASALPSEGQWEVALRKFDEALKSKPDSVPELCGRAEALFRLGHRPEALEAYDAALRIEPGSRKAMAGRAEVFEADGEWTRAANEWATYLGAAPADIDARLRRAECILKEGDRGRAVKELRKALRMAPSDARIQTRIEELAFNVPAVLSRALVASASGKYAEALEDFDEILAVDPDNVNALVGKGVALRRAGRTDKALAALDAALVKQPGNSAALLSKGQILEDQGSFEGALAAYNTLLEVNPRDAELWGLQGQVLEKLGEPEEALASYHEALKLDPANADWKNRAEALESSRKGQDAFLEELFTIKGIGAARARALLTAGYKTVEALRNATEDELANVQGMTRQVAAEVYRHFHPATVVPSAGPAPEDSGSPL